MKIVIAAPLYPPETTESALYTKNLSEILSKKEVVVTVITYTSIPEKISGVKILSINKQKQLIVRLFSFTKQLRLIAKENDIIYMQNGSSVELPVLIVSLLTKKPFIIHIGDKGAYKNARKNIFTKYIQNLAFNRAYKIITDTPIKRPEVLPFAPFPTNKQTKHEESWKKHKESLLKIFEDAK